LNIHDRPDHSDPVAGPLVGRHTEALERWAAAKQAAWRARVGKAPDLAELERAEDDALADVVALEMQSGEDVVFAIRQAVKHQAAGVRALLKEVGLPLVAGAVEELRTEIQDLADAVAALERNNH